ncbi:MAG: hypothetical protein QW711_04605 [Candidatus Korarchaeum sp.]
MTGRYEGRIYELLSREPVTASEVAVKLGITHKTTLKTLMHLYDTWGPEQLYLIVEDERDGERARRLVELRMRGASLG